MLYGTENHVSTGLS